MKLTKEEAIRRHRMMWEWIADETLKRKECVDKFDAFEHFGCDPCPVLSNCWCCEYCREVNTDGGCNHCPIIWPSHMGTMQCMDYYAPFSKNGLFVIWAIYVNRKDWRTAAYYALYISMLPERKD